MANSANATPYQTKHGTAAYFDANIFLGFYAYSKEDLEKLADVRELIRKGQIDLYLPTQTIDEIKRNREKVIAENIEQFTNQRGTSKVPLMMSGLAEVEDFQTAFKEAERKRSILLDKTKDLAADEKLKADILINKLIAVAMQIECDDKIYMLALRRHRTGNPPGKGSVRDEINWEALLRHCPSQCDLHVVSKDGDYRSVLDEKEAKAFLKQEWLAQKNGELFLHPDISTFLSAINIKIQLEADAMRALLVDDLVSSGSYQSTHRAIANLKPYIRTLTAGDAARLINAALENSQVGDIIGDDDVLAFYTELLDLHKALNDPAGNVRRLKAQMERQKNRATLDDF
jgi:hypothetical protein